MTGETRPAVGTISTQNQTEQPAPAYAAMPLPWERDKKWFRTFFSTWWLIIRHPVEAFSGKPPEGELLRPLLFMLLIATALALTIEATEALPALFKEASHGNFGKAVLVILFMLVLVFIYMVGYVLAFLVGGGIIHLLFKLFKLATKSQIATYRALAYSHSAQLLIFGAMLMAAVFRLNSDLYKIAGWIDLGFVLLIGAFSYYLACVALAAAHGCAKWKAFLVLLGPVLLLAYIAAP